MPLPKFAAGSIFGEWKIEKSNPCYAYSSNISKYQQQNARQLNMILKRIYLEDVFKKKTIVYSGTIDRDST